MCRYYNLGQCRYGQDCPFAHDESELSVPPDLTKTTMCEAWVAGNCHRSSEKCPYAHGEEELRVTPAFSSSVLCKRRSTKEDEFDNDEDYDQAQMLPQDLLSSSPGSPWSNVNASMPSFNLQGMAEADADRGFSPPRRGKGKGKGKGKAKKDSSGPVVNIAEHLEAARQRNSGTMRSSAMHPRTSGWMPQQPPAPAWPAPALPGVGSPGFTLPPPGNVPLLYNMFGLQDPNVDEHAKLSDLYAHCAAALADTTTATPASMASLSSASPMGWARTPSATESPERRGGRWNRTPSPSSPARSPKRRPPVPAYVGSPGGMVNFHELPADVHFHELQRIQEPPLSPEVRWARTPSTASPSVSPHRRVSGGLRFTNRGPPDLHRISDLRSAATRGQGGPTLSGSFGGTAHSWGAHWPPPPSAAAPGPPGPYVASLPLDPSLGGSWGRAAQDAFAFKQILESYQQEADALSETPAR